MALALSEEHEFNRKPLVDETSPMTYEGSSWGHRGACIKYKGLIRDRNKGEGAVESLFLKRPLHLANRT